MKIGKENFFIIEKIITIIVMVLIVFLSNSSYANDNQTINESLGMWIRNCLSISYDNGLSKAKLATSIEFTAFVTAITICPN